MEDPHHGDLDEDIIPTAFEARARESIVEYNKRVEGNLRYKFLSPPGSYRYKFDDNDYIGFRLKRREIRRKLLQLNQEDDESQSPLFKPDATIEGEIAKYMGFKRGIPVVNGTAANRLVIDHLFQLACGKDKFGKIQSDPAALYVVAPREIHTSLRHPLNLLGVNIHNIGDHNNFQRIRRTLEETPTEKKFRVLILEAIYSGRGLTYTEEEMQEMKGILILAKEKGFCVVVDMSHDAFLLGTNLFHKHGLTQYIDIATISGSKAKGGGHALLLLNDNDKTLRESFSGDPSYVFSSAPDREESMIDEELLGFHSLHGEARGKVALATANDLARVLNERNLSTSWAPSPSVTVTSSIVFLPIGSPSSAFFARDVLAKLGIKVAVFIPPGVPGVVSGLRFSASYSEDPASSVDAVANAVETVIDCVGKNIQLALQYSDPKERVLDRKLYEAILSRGIPMPKPLRIQGGVVYFH
ncbi:aminotransferase class I/II-fold pyridoxal phosphate-dependent enzyme [Candidatus Peregrinibacteria bacterium]|nr:MAG: aminotransferase class I/II-fold pyridoxal phosphate-dependent enzyme [Candidatus Peregrinibacteria bacterium]